MESSNSKRLHPNPLEGANNIAKLAKVYDKRVKDTRSAKGLDTVKEDDNDCEVTPIGSVVAEPVPVAKHEYKQAPTMTLNDLIPASFKPEPGASSKFNASFRSDRIEFVLMCRNLVAINQEDLD